MSSIPPEGHYGDVELELLHNEPPGLFPENQDSYWGQVRKVFADYLQGVVDQFADWYLNLDPRTVDLDDIDEWETMISVPTDKTALSLTQRRAILVARFSYGPFTRSARKAIVESFLVATFGPATVFSVGGIPITAPGITLYSGAFSLTGLYTITEDIQNFTYTVTIDPSVAVDLAAMSRELRRITPAHINFSVVSGSVVPPTSGRYGDGTYGGATYGG
jgi:hypothetical protein